MTIVTAAENHFPAANHNHDVANRRSRMMSDGNRRRHVFAGHRNILPPNIGDAAALVRGDASDAADPAGGRLISLRSAWQLSYVNNPVLS